jgi:hypothetical protein
MKPGFFLKLFHFISILVCLALAYTLIFIFAFFIMN